VPVVESDLPDPERITAPYDNFSQCFDHWELNWKNSGSKKGVAPTDKRKLGKGTPFVQRAQADFELLASKKGSADFVDYLNFNGGCSGVCKPEALFFFNRNTFELPD